MTMFLTILGWFGFGLAVLIGLGLDLLGLFGNWVILLAVTVAWVITDFEHFGVWCVIILTGLAVSGEIIEFVAASLGASAFGGSRKSALVTLAGCLIGAAVGTPLLPVVGTIIGACVGAFIGAASHEYLMSERRPQEAAWTGFGAAVGKIGGLLGKLLVGVIMLAVALLFY
jgi:hypothetical protein